jgi:hypothetical protein
MEICKPVCEPIQEFRRDLIVVKHSDQQTILRHATHEHSGLDLRAFSREIDPGRPPVNTHYSEIQAFRKSGIKYNFLLAEMLALLQGGEIQEAKVQRFLDLVD